MKDSTINKEPNSCDGEYAAGTCKCRIPKLVELSPMKIFRNLSNKVVHVMSGKRCLLKAAASAERPKKVVPPNDSHRSEAVEDCIKFINSSSSIPNSKLVSAETG